MKDYSIVSFRRWSTCSIRINVSPGPWSGFSFKILSSWKTYINYHGTYIDRDRRIETWSPWSDWPKNRIFWVNWMWGKSEKKNAGVQDVTKNIKKIQMPIELHIRYFPKEFTRLYLRRLQLWRMLNLQWKFGMAFRTKSNDFSRFPRN